MASVWVIEQGEYSDYRVVGVYSSRENAETALAVVNADPALYSLGKIDEWPLDPLVDEIRQGCTPWTVRMLRDGTTERVERGERVGITMMGAPPVVRRWSKAVAYRGQGIPDVLSGTVWARDAQHAVKIANERRTRLIAEGQWEEA